jgi:hypothetical protein
MARTATTTTAAAPVVDVTAALTSVMVDDKRRKELMREHARSVFDKALSALPHFEEALVTVFKAGVTAGQMALATAPRKRKSRKAAANGAQAPQAEAQTGQPAQE